MSRTEQLIAELTNRLRAMGHKEPEHPFKGLEELFSGKTRPTTTTASTTIMPKTTMTTKKPDMVDEEVRNEAKVTSAEINTREKQVQQVEGAIKQLLPVEEKFESGPEEKPVITVRPQAADIEVKNSEKKEEDKETKEIEAFPPEEEKREEPLIQNDPVQVRNPDPESPKPGATRPQEAVEDVSGNDNSQPKPSRAPWENQGEAIDFLRKKVEQLEARLIERWVHCFFYSIKSSKIKYIHQLG